MSTAERLIMRIAAADPLVGDAREVPGTAWADALLASVTSTDPHDERTPVTRPPRTPALRLAVATALVLALLAGGAYAAYELLRPSRAVERAVDGLSLPAPDAPGLAPRPESLRPLVWVEGLGRTWDLWSVRTADGRTLFVLGAESAGEPGQVLACPPLPADAPGMVCGRVVLPAGEAVVGRLRPGAEVRAASGPGAGAAARNDMFLVISPEPLETVAITDSSGAVLARLPVTPPDGG